MLIALGVFLYVLTASVTYSIKAKQVTRETGHRKDCGCDDCFGLPLLFGGFWVVAVPHALIMFLIGKFDSENRQEKELRAARHKADLAEEQAREMRALESAGGLK